MTLRLKKILKNIIFKLLQGILESSEKIIEKASIKKILIFEGGGIGDLLMLFPAISAIRDQFPGASISFLVSQNAKDILEIHPNRDAFSEILEYDPKQKHLSFMKKLELLWQMRGKRYDFIYAPSRGEGMREHVLMVFLMGAPYRIGFKKGRIGLLNTNSIEFSEDLPILRQNLELLKKADLMVKDEAIKVAIPENDIIFAEGLMHNRIEPFSGPAVSIHPGAKWNADYKSWPINNYIELIRGLIDLYDSMIVLVGSEGEAIIGEQIIKKVNRTNLINTIGKTTISQMAAVIHLTDVFVGNESGPLHLALVLNTPSIGIFGPTTPEQILHSSRNCIAISKKLPCKPCYTHQYAFEPACNNIECLKLISVEEVKQGVEKLFASLTKYKQFIKLGGSCE